MQQIGEGHSEREWSTRMVAQLGFIKKRLRYPISRQTIIPILLLGTSIPAICFLMYLMLSKSASVPKHYWALAIAVVAFFIPAIMAGRRYLQTLRFMAVPAQMRLADNVALLIQFLKENHFAFGRHPQAPEVFNIISKSISSLRDEREVVIFIADDKRILVNSHFTRTRYRSPIGNPHYKQMAKMLSEWLRQRAQSSSTTTLQPF